jgi:hypothetical protein
MALTGVEIIFGNAFGGATIKIILSVDLFEFDDRLFGRF